MPNPAIGAMMIAAVGSMEQADAAGKASQQQADASQLGIAAQKDSQAKIMELLQPYVGAGSAAMDEAMGLLGLEKYVVPGTEGSTSGPLGAKEMALIAAGITPLKVGTQTQVGYKTNLDKQTSAIDALKNSPLFQTLLSQGQESMLQTASASGGLRGGNTQAAMAQFAPAMLKKEIEDRYAKLMGVAQLGQASAAGVGSAGITTGTNISNLFGNIGAAQAAGSLAQGNAMSQLTSLPMNYLAMQYGAGIKNPSFGEF